MEPVIQVAIITVAGSLALAIIGGFIKILINIFDEKKFQRDIASKIDLKIGNTESGSLSKQHENMEKSIKDVVVDKTNNLKEMQERNFLQLYPKIENIDKYIDGERENKILRYNNLNESQKRLEDSFKTMAAFGEEWKRVNEENIRLKQENQILVEKNRELLNQIRTYENERDELEQ